MSKPSPIPVPSTAVTGLLLLCLAVPVGTLAQGTVRNYYIAAEEVTWDHAPGRPGSPVMASRDSESVAVRRSQRQRRLVFREYDGPGFQLYKARAEHHEHLGLLGPLLRATVGDTLRVVFLNNTQEAALSLHAGGLHYDKASEGLGYADGTAGFDRLDDSVAPGNTHTYTWQVTAEAGPGPADPSSILRLYESGHHEGNVIGNGLLGPIIISRPFQSHEDATPADIDREFVTLLAVYGRDGEAPTPDSAVYTINGLRAGHLPELAVTAGDRVRWHVLSPGRAGLRHTPHWHGNNVIAYGSYTDRIGLQPWVTRSVTMQAMNPGTWLFHCLVDGHTESGMAATYTVNTP